MLERGLFIVFEGCDGSGKSTQCKKLYEHLRPDIKCELINFPDRQTPIGRCINSYLQNKANISDEAIHLLFSANRWEKMKYIESCLSQGQTIICDRYVYSGIAFSSAKSLEFEWCKSADKGLLKPDIVIYMDIKPSKLAKRPNFGLERYEQIDFQERVYLQYQKLIEQDWIIIDAEKDISEISQEIFNKIKSTLKNRSDTKIYKLWV